MFSFREEPGETRSSAYLEEDQGRYKTPENFPPNQREVPAVEFGFACHAILKGHLPVIIRNGDRDARQPMC